MIGKTRTLVGLLAVVALVAVAMGQNQEPQETVGSAGKWYSGTIAADGKVINPGTGGWKLIYKRNGHYVIQFGPKKDAPFEARRDPNNPKYNLVTMTVSLHGEMDSAERRTVSTTGGYGIGQVHITDRETRTGFIGQDWPFSFVAHVRDK